MLHLGVEGIAAFVQVHEQHLVGQHAFGFQGCDQIVQRVVNRQSTDAVILRIFMNSWSLSAVALFICNSSTCAGQSLRWQPKAYWPIRFFVHSDNGGDRVYTQGHPGNNLRTVRWDPRARVCQCAVPHCQSAPRHRVPRDDALRRSFDDVLRAWAAATWRASKRRQAPTWTATTIGQLAGRNYVPAQRARPQLAPQPHLDPLPKRHRRRRRPQRRKIQAFAQPPVRPLVLGTMMASLRKYSWYTVNENSHHCNMSNLFLTSWRIPKSSQTYGAIPLTTP